MPIKQSLPRMPPIQEKWENEGRESMETPSATRQYIGSGGAVAMVLVFVAEVIDSRLVIHPHSLFGDMIPYKKYASFPSGNSATLLNNPLYCLKLARLVVPVPDHQFILKRNMAPPTSQI